MNLVFKECNTRSAVTEIIDSPNRYYYNSNDTIKSKSTGQNDIKIKSGSINDLSEKDILVKPVKSGSDLAYAINIVSIESLDTIKENKLSEGQDEKLGRASNKPKNSNYRQGQNTRKEKKGSLEGYNQQREVIAQIEIQKEKNSEKENNSQKEFKKLNKEGKLDDALTSSPSINRGLRSITPIFTERIVPNIRKSLSLSSPRSPDLDVTFLRNENTRLQNQIEEFRNQTHYLEVEVETLRSSLKKSQEAKEIQKLVMQGLERQVRVLETATLRLPEMRPLSSKRRNSSLPENLNEVGKRSPLDDGRLDIPPPRRHSTFSESADFPDFGPHKVILLGSSGVGKSSFIKRLCDDVFSEIIMPSFGLDFKTKVVSVSGEEESLQLWDTAGQDRFRKITQSYLNKVHGLILMYDITSEESFKHLHRWMCFIKKSDMRWAPVTIIGNKFDLHHRRCVTMEMGRQMAEFYGADFAEVSAKNGENVEEVARNTVRNLMVKRAVNSSREYLTERGFDEWEEMEGKRGGGEGSDFVETLCSCCIM